MQPGSKTLTQQRDDLERLARTLGKRLGEDHVSRDVPLGPLTTFRIGGPADLLVEVHGRRELELAVEIARMFETPRFLLGLGANILVGDGGFRGLVIRNLARRMHLDRQQERIEAESGVICYPDLVELAVSNHLSGLEHYAGIPSTVGGALWQNLHFLSPPPERSRTMYIEEVLLGAEILTAEGEVRDVGADYFLFDYDYSVLHERDDVVLAATFQLEKGDERTMREVMQANLDWRKTRHPPLDTEPSAGSIFKKIEGIGAGRLIDEAGLKGYRVGGAEITERHANIVVNRGGATAADVLAVIRHARETVMKRTGHRLEAEISFVGDFAEQDVADLVSD
jgi:UDP-N-acetylmuramate dehydrogenase